MYELKAYRKPLIKGHHPIPIEDGGIAQCASFESTLEEAKHLFGRADCWQITINEFSLDSNNEVIKSTPHWCATLEQVQTWLDETSKG
jgi:hypothetical protein